MGQILSNFTIARNILANTKERSATRVLEYLSIVGSGLDSEGFNRLTKGERNDISAFANYTGMFRRPPEGGYVPSELAAYYENMAQENPQDAWQWLITRTLWHYVVPNGTASPVNRTARELSVEFGFFKHILVLLALLDALPGEDRGLYFHELCVYLNEDANWMATPLQSFTAIMELRNQGGVVRDRCLLGDLEDEFDIPRDNLNTVFVKAFRQTGLFSYHRIDGRTVGIYLSDDLSSVLRNRVRHVIDTPLDHAAAVSDWNVFIGMHEEDLPLDVELTSADDDVDTLDELSPEADMSALCSRAQSDFREAGLNFDLPFIRRFFAACITKPFVILTGLSGSGKTKLAEAASLWLTKHPELIMDPFEEGRTIQADRTQYRIKASDRFAIVLETDREGESSPKITTLPRALIDDWVRTIRTNDFSRSTPAREIRAAVALTTDHDLQINAFESHLKACAFAYIEKATSGLAVSCSKVVPVGPDWMSSENILGYPDALNPDNYIRTPALDVILSAVKRPDVPHFLILDEMNLSHVERYFADVLSALETKEPIELYTCAEEELHRRGVPPVISKLPQNLIVVGTVNVDETTHLFSPKVLDRANVLEFRVSIDDLQSYMNNPSDVCLKVLEGRGAGFAKEFLRARQGAWRVSSEVGSKLSAEMSLLFRIMAEHEAEFGYRVAKEISRFIHHYHELATTEFSFEEALDYQVMQKILPKLHGSERSLKPVLWAIATYASVERTWSEEEGGSFVLVNSEELAARALEAMKLNSADPFRRDVENTVLPVTYSKCRRMSERLRKNGFTSYAEA